MHGCVDTTVHQGDALQLNSPGVLAVSCHRPALSLMHWAAVSVIATGFQDKVELSSLCSIGKSSAVRSAIKDTCNTLTNGATTAAKLTVTSLSLLSGVGDKVQSPVGRCA